MPEHSLEVCNRLGLHARAATKLVQTLAPFRATVMLGVRGREVNAKSIMGVMLLAAGQGTQVTLRAEGDDADAALAAAVDLFLRKFDEGE
jgi:phosphocarrier protein HPr